ncbi:hypothetical protein CEP82_012160 [Mobiluncus mulieris]|nr:hypothetical protein CEP82_012160 [Mobiluncus mulieris]
MGMMFSSVAVLEILPWCESGFSFITGLSTLLLSMTISKAIMVGYHWRIVLCFQMRMIAAQGLGYRRIFDVFSRVVGFFILMILRPGRPCYRVVMLPII